MSTILDKYRNLFGYLALVAAVAFLFAQSYSQQNQLHTSVASQLHNRVENVAAWCNGINQTRNYEREIAHYAIPIKNDTIPVIIANLNCKKLESQTVHSAK